MKGDALATLVEDAAALGEQIRQRPAITAALGLGIRNVVATGLGSSAANARLLVSVLNAQGPIPARFLPTDSLARSAPVGAADALLVVFSQGFSPNARTALTHAGRFARVAIVSAAHASESRRDALEAAARAGATILDPGSGEEFGTLLRIRGPMLGQLTALELAAGLGAPIELDRAAIADAVEAAYTSGRSEADASDTVAPETLRIVSAGFAERCDNLQLKLVEGLCVALPPVEDALTVAHGPLQSWYERDALVLAPHDGMHESRTAIERLRACLAPRHRCVEVGSRLGGACATLEHEAWFDGFVLRWMERGGIDPAHWPGRDRDEAIYRVGSELEPARAGTGSAPKTLATQRWPELEALLAEGGACALLPLGSTEQHGPHLPFSTDTRIADALARRWAARHPGWVALPALPVGCASEHMDFPGTLSISPGTLRALLDDLADSVARHGFERLVVFSAHGGNLGPLRDARERLEARVRPGIRVLTEHRALNDALAAIGERDGIARNEQGPHAGELETSILLHIAPESVRRERLDAGRTGPPLPDDQLFYPSLRPNAPSGVVGDPRGASPARGERYLQAWVDALDAWAGSA